MRRLPFKRASPRGDAEFITIWRQCDTLEEVAALTGYTTKTCTNRALQLRRIGVDMHPIRSEPPPVSTVRIKPIKEREFVSLLAQHANPTDAVDAIAKQTKLHPTAVRMWLETIAARESRPRIDEPQEEACE